MELATLWWKHGRHESADRLGINDRKRDLVRLSSHKSSPDGIALRPEVFPLVIKALGVLIDDDPEREAIEPCHDAAVELRRTRIDGNGVTFVRIADRLRTSVEHQPQKRACVIRRSANDEVGRCIAPDLAQPVDVGFEPACCHHSDLGADRSIPAACPHDRGAELPFEQIEVHNLGVVDDPNPKTLGSGVIAVHERLAAAQKERVGAGQMQRASQG